MSDKYKNISPEFAKIMIERSDPATAARLKKLFAGGTPEQWAAYEQEQTFKLSKAITSILDDPVNQGLANLGQGNYGAAAGNVVEAVGDAVQKGATKVAGGIGDIIGDFLSAWLGEVFSSETVWFVALALAAGFIVTAVVVKKM